jgi:hypothetical protein
MIKSEIKYNLRDFDEIQFIDARKEKDLVVEYDEKEYYDEKIILKNKQAENEVFHSIKCKDIIAYKEILLKFYKENLHLDNKCIDLLRYFWDKDNQKMVEHNSTMVIFKDYEELYAGTGIATYATMRKHLIILQNYGFINRRKGRKNSYVVNIKRYTRPAKFIKFIELEY